MAQTLRDNCQAVLNNPFFIASPTLNEVTIWEPNGELNTNQLFIRPAAEDDPLMPAQLEFIAQVSPERFNLIPCGGWQDRWEKPLWLTRANAFLVAPRSDDLRPAWNPVPDAVNNIQNSKRMPNVEIKNAILQQLVGTKQDAVRVCHSLFLVSH